MATLGRAQADRPRVLVLPLPAGQAADAGAARAFDARLLVALHDTRRVVAVTLDEELACTSPRCLADAGAAAKARWVLTPSLVRAAGRLTLFATLIDAATGDAARRVELGAVTPRALATTAPIQLAQRLFGAPPGPAVVGVGERGRPTGVADAIASRLAALRTFTVVPATGAGASLTHRAVIDVTRLAVERRVHHVHHYLDGVLAATLTIVELSTNRVVFARPVKVTVSRRARYSSRAEVTALLIEAAANEWMTAFVAARTETLLQGGTK